MSLAEIKAVAAILESALKAHSATEDELLVAPMEHCIEQLGQAGHGAGFGDDGRPALLHDPGHDAGLRSAPGAEHGALDAEPAQQLGAVSE